MTAIAFANVPDIEKLFCALPDDKDIARIFRLSQTRDLCRLVGLELPKWNRREHLLIGAIRERLEEPDTIQVPTCPCEGLGRRWILADSNQEVYYGIHSSISTVFPDAVDYVHESFTYVASFGERLRYVPVPRNTVPHVIVEAAPYDGPGRTLGVTLVFNSDEDALSAGPVGAPQVRVIMDTAEDWTIDYFRTVMRHELFHVSGILEHASVFRDLMYRSYTGVHLGHPGEWTANHMLDKYTRIVPT